MSGGKLFLLGSPYLEQNGLKIQITRRKALALLAYLAMTRQSHTRSLLACLLWPEMDEPRSRTALRRVLSDLNGPVRRSWAQLEEDRVALHPATEFWVDVEEFQACLASCHSHPHGPDEVCRDCLCPLSAAVRLYRGDFLAGFTLSDGPGFDEWQFFQRESLRQFMVSALRRLVDGHRTYGDIDSAILYARRLLAYEPWDEATHRALMEFYHESGRSAAALRQYDDAYRILAEELDVLPAAETTALYDRIRAARLSPLPPEEKRGPNHTMEERPSGRAPDRTAPDEVSRRLVNLPAPMTTFVGREAELSMLQQLLDQGAARLITLVAPSGMGKTHLALEFARRQISAFPDGVWFLELASIQSPEQMVSAMIAMMSLEFPDPNDIQLRLLRYLRDKTMLFLLDNFEHLAAGAGLIRDMLQAAPDLRVIVTSQQRLNLSAETIYPIGGLTITEKTTRDEASLSAAVELFVQAARRVCVDFELSSDDVQQVIWICEAVEGMPLAIVLAASWVEVLSVAEIAVEITRSLDFLSTELSDLPRRQWSLRAVFEATWQRLTDREQDIFMRLSIFQGNFTRDAALAVAGARLATLKSLVDKSLVGRTAEGRYFVHELVQQYAQERLEATGNAAAVNRTYTQYFLDQTEKET